MREPSRTGDDLPSCVLLGYDASESADSALYKVVDRLRGAPVHLVLAYAEPPLGAWCTPGGLALTPWQSGWAQADFVRTLAEIRMLGEPVDWEFTSRIGAATAFLRYTARAAGAGAIVLGRTRRRWGRTFSVAARLSRSAPAPVHVR